MKISDRRRWTFLILVMLIIAGSASMIVNLSRITGGISDYRAYWAASRLLLQGKDFSDDENLLEIQQEETEWSEEYAMKTWNPPWTLIWLLPYAILPFNISAKVWLLTNIFFLIAGVFIFWRECDSDSPKALHLEMALALAILFPSALVAMWVGQVSLIVPFAIAVSVALFVKSHDLSAGVALSLAMVKPHIAYLTIPIILIVAIKQRRWKVLVGFLTSLLVSILVALILRPVFILEYFDSTTGSELLAWQSPTLTAYLQANTGLQWIRLIGIPIMLAAIYFYFHASEKYDLLFLVSATMLISIITTPFGWSYDFVVLLLPLTFLSVALTSSDTSRWLKLFISTAVILIYTAFFIQRIKEQNELNFFWVPLAIGAVFCTAAYFLHRRYLISGTEISSDPQH